MNEHVSWFESLNPSYRGTITVTGRGYSSCAVVTGVQDTYCLAHAHVLVLLATVPKIYKAAQANRSQFLLHGKAPRWRTLKQKRRGQG